MPDTKEPIEQYALLIRLDTKVDYLTHEVKELRDNNNKRIDSLELTKFDSKEFAETWGKMISDHETRLRFIEKYVWMILGIVSLINFIGIGTVIYFVTHH